MENLQIKYQLNSLVLRNKKEFVRLEATNEDDFAQICLNKGDVIDVIKHLAEWAGIELPSELNTKALPLHGVTHRNLPTMDDIEKWNCPPAYLKDGEIMHRNWIDEETQFIHEMINDFIVAHYGG